MKQNIKNTFRTLIKTFLFLIFLVGVSYYLGWRHYNVPLLSAVYIVLLFLLLFLKRLWIKWRRSFVLHFSIKKIDRMTGAEFEDYLKLQFEHLGFKAQTTKASNDYGADLILRKKKHTISVQAKRYQCSIGVKAVQEVIGSMAYYGTSRGLVVTNSYYTKNAVKLALANDIILWDRDTLVLLITKENMNGYLAKLMV